MSHKMNGYEEGRRELLSGVSVRVRLYQAAQEGKYIPLAAQEGK